MTGIDCLQAIFEKYDRDGSGRIEANELREALYSLGFQVSGIVLDLLVFKFNTTGGGRSIQYDNFIEYALISLLLLNLPGFLRFQII